MFKTKSKEVRKKALARAFWLTAGFSLAELMGLIIYARVIPSEELASTVGGTIFIISLALGLLVMVSGWKEEMTWTKSMALIWQSLIALILFSSTCSPD
ncbi:MAG: hypothetical protein HQ519_11825 [Planctomycetes bacterium]|nr:hypothetical protein [Planctomycetota bacterium]